MYRVLIIILFLFTRPVFASEVTFQINTEHYYPFHFVENGKLKGIATDRIKEIFQDAQIPYKINTYPWNRAYQEALQQKNTCVYSTTITEKRKPLFKWVSPLVYNEWVFYARSDSDIVINELDEAHQYKIGGYLNDAIALYLKEQGLPVIEARHDEKNVKLLNAGRLDLWATGKFQGKIQAEKLGINLKQVYAFKVTELGLACHKDIDDRIIQKLQSALDTLK